MKNLTILSATILVIGFTPVGAHAQRSESLTIKDYTMITELCTERHRKKRAINRCQQTEGAALQRVYNLDIVMTKSAWQCVTRHSKRPTVMEACLNALGIKTQ